LWILSRDPNLQGRAEKRDQNCEMGPEMEQAQLLNPLRKKISVKERPREYPSKGG